MYVPHIPLPRWMLCSVCVDKITIGIGAEVRESAVQLSQMVRAVDIIRFPFHPFLFCGGVSH